jgi:hypothetical protein
MQGARSGGDLSSGGVRPSRRLAHTAALEQRVRELEERLPLGANERLFLELQIKNRAELIQKQQIALLEEIELVRTLEEALRQIRSAADEMMTGRSSLLNKIAALADAALAPAPTAQGE